jgi:hypothetical protein
VVGFAAPAPEQPRFRRDAGARIAAFRRLRTQQHDDDRLPRSRSVGAFYLYDSTPASLVVYVNGSQVDPSLALRELVSSHTRFLAAARAPNRCGISKRRPRDSSCRIP